MAKPNYSFEKRQRELEKKKKKEEKLKRKLTRGPEPQVVAARGKSSECCHNPPRIRWRCPGGAGAYRKINHVMVSRLNHVRGIIRPCASLP